MVQLLHVNPDEFLVDTFRLGKKIYLSGFRPKHAISLWRGGTPVGLGVDAFFRSRGLRINHTTIATDSYVGISQQAEVTVKNIDDVYESGNTIRRVVELLRQKARANAPRDIVVAAVHTKPGRSSYHELPVIALEEIPDDVWIDYPHELADLVDPADPDDRRIREKDEDIWRILRSGPSARSEVEPKGPYTYFTPREMLLDCVRLGVNIAHDQSFRPDFIVALWPGGVSAGLPLHEVYKYFQAKAGGGGKAPDHISVNTYPTRLSYRTQILGLHYLEDHINKDDNILIVDTTFRAGRLVNAVVANLKEALRRNLDHDRVRVASVYYNPDDRSTWTVRPDIRRPDYYLRTVRNEVIYPQSVHNLPNPHHDLATLNPALWRVLYEEG
jgi:hypoxanthine phosphoribosyltransferase